jgi:hypothetical protein
MVMFIGPNGIEMAQTDSQGQFDVTGLPMGSYMVTAFDPGRLAGGNTNFQFAPQVVDILGGEVANLNLGPGSLGDEQANSNTGSNLVGASAPVTGTITGLGNGTTAVALRRPGGPAVEALSIANLGGLIEAMRYLAGQTFVNGDGTFSLDGIAPGTYILEVYSVDFPQGRPDPMAWLNGTRTPVYRQEITITPDQPPVFNINLPTP